MSETFNKLKQCISDTRSWLQARGVRRREYVTGISVLLLVGVIYTFSKSSDHPQSSAWTERANEFKKSRVLGDPYATSARVKDRMLSRSAKESQDHQKMVLDRMAVIDSKLNDLETKIHGRGAEENPTVPSQDVLPTQEPSLKGTPQAAGVITSQGPEQPRMHRRSAFTPLDGEESTMSTMMKQARGPKLLSFPVPDSEKKTHPEIVLPVGSYVKAKLLTGVEAPEGTPYPVLMQLDFASIIPNHKSLDLHGCFMIAKAQGDLSTERVQMQATKLSCVSRSGRMFERDINGFIADGKDNSFAVIGTVNTKQDRVAVMAFLSSVVEGVGRTIQMAQTSEQTSADGTSRKILSGSQGKYIGAGGASDAAGMVAQWYLKQAQSLLPTINVGSGQDVWVVMNESVELPQEYFKKLSAGENHGKDYSIVHRLFD